ncbi:hypothetical protein [uncultured Kordia sp.]|uniref:hypothetical protein n=1 Tax=uncultured Kordia sp. TaxID=507699 RepID=UPI0026384B28|nr:hypothetical protein [uncultured Kordia sp.]
MKLPSKIMCVCMLLLIGTNEMYSQRVSSYHDREFAFIHNNINSLAYSDLTNGESLESVISKAEGSQFYDATFREATISSTENVFKVRYNAFLDEMEILDKDAVVILDKRHQKHLIAFPEKNLRYKVLRENNEDNTSTLAYFVLLEEDNYLSLYRKDHKKYVPSRNQRTSDKAEFQNARSRFYVEINNSGTVIPLPRNNKEFAALFSTKKEKVKAYIKQENLKVRKENDLLKLIKYINSI